MRCGIFASAKAAGLSFLLLTVLLLPACALGDPDPDANYATVFYHSGVANYLRDEVRSARSSIKIALNRFVENRQLIMELNNAASRGVEVQVVLDTQHEATAAGLTLPVSVVSGNPFGDMQSNFAIMDGTAIFFSDCDLLNPNTVAITIKQVDLVSTLETEFRQMHNNSAFGSKESGGSRAKQEINHKTIFRTAQGSVEMYFLPQNKGAINYMMARMKQAKKSVDVYAKYFNNDYLNLDFTDIAGSGLANYFACGNANIKSSLRPFLTASKENDIVDVDLPCNAIFVDVGTADETLIFTTFPYMSVDQLSISDGIVLFVRGSGLRQLKEALDYYVRVSPKWGLEPPGDAPITSTIKIAAYNMLRLGENPKNYYELARSVIDGGFDIVGITELMTPYTNAIASVDAGPSAIGRGKGISDLILNLEYFTGTNTWGQHVSETRVGRTGYFEYYGYVYKKDVLKCIGYPPGGKTSGLGTGFYNDIDATFGEFIRPPYAARFEHMGTGVSFTYILQHAEFGDLADREREASLLYKVYVDFMSTGPTGRRIGIPVGEEIIIGGDFNLPADDPAFTTMYNMPAVALSGLTWAIHPSTLTTVGNIGFVSAYDNFWYSTKTTHERVLGNGRGAYESWVTLNDYSPYPGYNKNNFTYVNTYISDHIPVYITFNTTACTVPTCNCTQLP